MEGPSKKHPDELSGRTSSNRVVNFRGRPRLIGRLLDVTSTDALRNSLRGELVLEPERSRAPAPA